MSSSTLQLRDRSRLRPTAALPQRPATPITMAWALTAHLPTFEHPGDKRLGGSTVAALERGFAATVAQQLRGGVLRHNDRQALLRAADRLHIERFRANLIIALIQREMSRSGGPPLPPLNESEQDYAPPSRYDRIVTWAVLAVCVEMAMGLGAYWHFCH